MPTVYDVIIPQMDPKVQEVINNFRTRMEKIQISEQCKQRFESINKILQVNLDPEIQNKLEQFKHYNEKIQNSEQYKQTLESINKKLQIKLDPEVQDKLEQFKHQAEVFNEKIKAILETVVVIAKKTVVNVYKKIVSCSRAVRSHIKASNFSKSSSGDSGDSDQPEPPRSPHHLAPTQQQNSFIHSWQTTPGYCSMVGGGQI